MYACFSLGVSVLVLLEVSMCVLVLLVFFSQGESVSLFCFRGECACFSLG